MNDNVKITLLIKAPPEVGREAMFAAIRKLREGGRQPMRIDPGQCHTISDPGHCHGMVPAPADLTAEAHRQMMARNLMTVRPLPCEQE
ncbi:hypothetical protein SB861_03280 [Paraburkholderia sp. SIMBA_049]